MSMRYEYRVLRAHTVLEIAAPQWQEDSYIARDEPAVAYKQALADGFRWVRTEGEWAIFERAIDYGPETAEFEVRSPPAGNHTPGPWRFMGECEPIGCRPDGASVFQIWEERGGHRIIAEVVSTEDESIGVTEGIANANLMAAATEMLEALQDVANCLENWMEIAEEHDQREYDIEAMRKARAAIAKATGVTNG